MTKRQQIASVIGLLAGSLALNASAAVQYTPWQTFDTGRLQTGSAGDTSITFDQYNPAEWGGYDLHNVQLELDAVGLAAYIFVDQSGATNEFTFQADLTVSVSSTATGDLVVALPNIIDEQRSVGPNGQYSSPGYPTDFDDPNVLTATDSNSEHYVGGSLTADIINLFTGTGTVDLDAGATIANTTSSTGDNLTGLNSRYEATGRIRYSYNVPETPEPGTMALFGFGLAGVGAAVRRRRKGA